MQNAGILHFFYNSRHTGVFVAICLLFSGFITNSCRNERSPYLLRDIVPPDDFTFIDTLKEQAIRSYITHPDLAENLLNQATHACDSIRLPQKKFQILLEKAEFYQYRKPDFLKSVRNLSEAVSIFIQHPGPYAEDPYIYINIGNFFYRLRHFDKANSFYRLGVVMAEKLGLQHARAIALQNIGLSWQEMKVYDSALYYFHYATDHSFSIGYLTRAQSFLYLSTVSYTLNDLNSMRIETDSAFALIIKFRNQQPKDLGTVHPKLLATSQEMEGKLHKQMFEYYQKRNKPDSAAMHLDLALSQTRKIGAHPLLAEIYLEKLQHVRQADQIASYPALADSVLNSASHIRDPFIRRAFIDSLASFFAQVGDKNRIDQYSLISGGLTDSINNLLGSDELLENQMLISSAAAEQVIQKLHFEKSRDRMEIMFFRTISIIVLSAVILGIIVMVVMIRQKRSLKMAYRNLSSRIQQSLKTPLPPVIEIQTPVQDKRSGIIQKLEEMMEHEPIFEKDLTLAELANLLHTNKTYLSETINHHYGLNFNDFINQQRVKEACRLMMEPDSQRLSFEQISEKCGFNSRSTFYAAFKKSTGMSPAAFSRTLRKEKLG
jgi:AraC-like DNA-binding protein